MSVPRTGRWVPATWTTLLVLVAAMGGSVAGGLASKALVLDLLAVWPLAAPAVPLGIVAAVLRRGGRLSAAAPLVLVTWVVVAVILHAGGWSELPSSSASWSVASAGDRAASLRLTADHGRVDISAGSGEAAVSIDPIRLGGDTAPPAATARRRGTALEVAVAERPEAGWLGFGGWRVRLDPGPLWDVDVSAPEVDVDLTGMRVSSVQVAGSGRIVLGGPPAPVTVAGEATVVVPLGAPAVVTGEATVPPGWARTSSGWASPGAVPDGDVWAIVAGGPTVHVEVG